jgi:hypothetical protein
MNKVVLYIKDADNVFQAVDLFEDETISVTSKIQDIRDISKVFTDFSQSFTVPASKKNNKIFRHFYNYFISEGEFDARKKVDARLEINYIPFREGKIFLNGVKMKENKPFAYNVTFYGNTVTLKDLLGDDELESLTWIDKFKYQYTSPNTKTRLTSNLNQTVDSVVKYDPIIVPLVTHTKRLYFNSDTSHSANTISGDLHYFDSQGNTHNKDVALQFDDLKPAIRLLYIIEAIENKYNVAKGYPVDLIFTRDFFNSEAFAGDGTAENRGLYMWLSREKGKIGGDDETTETTLSSFAYDSGDQLSDFFEYPFGGSITPSFITDGGETDSVLRVQTFLGGGSFKNADRYRILLDLTVTTTASTSYSVSMINTLDNNSTVGVFDNLTSTQTVSTTLAIPSTIPGDLKDWGIKFLVNSEGGFQADLSLRIRQQKADNSVASYSTIYDAYYDAASITATDSGEIIPTERIPKMKTIDFLTGIFKTFNLTSYFIDDRNDADYGKIRVLPLDDYYNDNPKIFNITKYTDSSETDVESTVPFSEIEFKNKKPKTLLMLNHEEVNNEVFGDAIYHPQGVDRGKPYKIETPFEHFKFERLIDENTSGIGLTAFQWGYSAGNNFKPDADAEPQPTANYDSVLTAPFLFYGIRVNGLAGDYRLNWNGAAHEGLTSYWKPSNTVESGTASVPPDFTINFDDEIDEWNQQNYGGETNSLFKKFYQTYIEDAFNAKKRIFKLTAHLPSSILLNYELNDRFQIGDKVFTINSIDTNLKTGESKLELLNVL